jgi:glyoxylase-like metal-dependent hydrolase (beta-lactamase superfamily II)
VGLRSVLTPGPRPDHVAYILDHGQFALVGDLDGPRGARSILGPPDEVAWASSLQRLVDLAPTARHLTGHPPTLDDPV